MSNWYSDDPNDYHTIIRSDTPSDSMAAQLDKPVRLDLESDRFAWLENAGCKGVDPKLFDAHLPTKATRLLCGGCPVIDDCLRFTLAGDLQSGFAAGMTSPERDRLKERLAA